MFESDSGAGVQGAKKLNKIFGSHTSAYLFCMAVSPVTDCKNPLEEPLGRASSVLPKVITVATLSHGDVKQT